jgi:hypothetical protein
MQAIIGNFTGQQIQQQIEMGKNLIELPYYFRKVPDNIFGAIIAHTQQPRIVGDRAGIMGKTDFLFELHTHLSLNLHHFVDGHFEIEIGEIAPQVDPEEIKFVLVEDEDYEISEF